jgi:nucleotide-binding universal stress UspA family protein
MNYLVPIDFSEQSKTAAEYAAALTRTWPGNVQLLHVIVPIEEESAYIPVKTLNVKKNTVFEIFTFQEQIRRKFNVRTGAEMVSGPFVSRVLKTAAKEKSDLIVVGMQGTSGLREHLYGSNTIALIENSTLPVLAVPADITFESLRHLVYVTDHSEADIANINALGKIAAKFKGLLSIVSINTHSDESHVQAFQATVRASIPFAAVNFEDRIHPVGKIEGLEEFCLTESADLIGISNSHTEDVRKIAGRSLSGDEFFSVDAPVLYFPS